ncbi:MAG: LytR/AlgR family response regulator transcription factor [Oligoflexus sp.]
MSISVLVVDDEQIARKRIVRLLEDHHEPFIIRESTDAIVACNLMQAFQPEIIFLDINMPKYSGFDFLKMSNLKNIKIIFQTAYSEYAVQAFEAEAENYLLKPFSKERFYKVLNKALNSLGKKDSSKQIDNIVVKIGNKEKLINVSTIYYFGTTNHTSFLVLKDRIFSCSYSLQELEEKLNPEVFIRVHRNTLLNRAYVESWSNTYPMVIHLKNGDSLRVSKERRRKVREFFTHA